MPTKVLKAYATFLEDLMVHNCLAGGVGTPCQRRCGIPQGCPFSMTLVALIMRPWIILMRGVGGITCYILADDVLIIAQGRSMIGAAAEAINKTHLYLKKMGAKVTEGKSYNFATTKNARTWMEETWWEHLDDKISVAKQLRYLGAHINTDSNCRSGTLEERWTKAITHPKSYGIYQPRSKQR